MPCIFKKMSWQSLLHGKMNPNLPVCNTSALWADAFYRLKCPSVCPFVCLFVCLSVCSLLRYRLNVFLPSLPKVRFPIFLEIQNHWGKVIGRSGIRLEHFCLEVVLNRQTKESSFFWLILPYKTRWKPRFPMD